MCCNAVYWLISYKLIHGCRHVIAWTMLNCVWCVYNGLSCYYYLSTIELNVTFSEHRNKKKCQNLKDPSPSWIKSLGYFHAPWIITGLLLMSLADKGLPKSKVTKAQSIGSPSKSNLLLDFIKQKSTYVGKNSQVPNI